ncbi:hypothetical protein BDR04DRAFT_1228915 [Suillus decipiens]|nr:hypothetical protein BDR04DRAFT_1228915 [Suillus decipiens]
MVMARAVAIYQAELAKGPTEEKKGRRTRLDEFVKLCKERNKVTGAIYETQKAEWEGGRDLAKSERRRPRWNKPKMVAIEKPVLRPERVHVYESEQEDGEDD